MGKIHLANLARLAVLLCAAIALMPATATAGGHRCRDCNDASAAFDPSGWQAVSPYDGAFMFPSDAAWCYANPILAVYQMPAAMAKQPGSDVGYLRVNPTPGLLGGRPYLYHP